MLTHPKPVRWSFSKAKKPASGRCLRLTSWRLSGSNFGTGSFQEACGMGPFLPTTCLRAQESSTWRTGRNFLPKVVGAYSTRTGISANISLTTSPSLASSRNCCVSTFCEIRGILPRRSLKRRGSSLFRSHQRITGFHRPPISAISSSIGQKLAMRLELTFPSQIVETRFPFGFWYPAYSTTADAATRPRKKNGKSSLRRGRLRNRAARRSKVCVSTHTQW